MKEQGYKRVTAWLDAKEGAVVAAAARRIGMPLATFIRRAAVEAAWEQRLGELPDGTWGRVTES